MKERFQCAECNASFHYYCYGVPDGLFPNRLQTQSKPITHISGNIGRIGDTRRPDFVCPRCNFKQVMRREPLVGSISDAWLGVLDMRTTLDEFISDSESYANGCRYTLGKVCRFGRDMGIPTMIAHHHSGLDRIPRDHRWLRWYLADLTRVTTWDTAKGHRAAIYNYYERMGVPVDQIPTNTHRFRHFMNGMLQRKGISMNQDQVFSRLAVGAMVRLLRSDYERAEGWRSGRRCAGMAARARRGSWGRLTAAHRPGVWRSGTLLNQQAAPPTVTMAGAAAPIHEAATVASVTAYPSNRRSKVRPRASCSSGHRTPSLSVTLRSSAPRRM